MDSTPFLIPSVVTALSTESERVLSFGIAKIDGAFPGFHRGDFAVLYGHLLCEKLLFLLSVRCQLPFKLGGLNSRVIYLDGGNTFDPYAISAIAREHGLEPRSALENIFISRAFTAYHLTSFIFEELEEALRRYGARFVIVSAITGLFLDRNVAERESEETFKEMVKRLAGLAAKRRLIIVASHSPRPASGRNTYLQSVLFASANIVIGIKESKGVPKLVLESHPHLLPFTVNLLPDEVTLDTFMEAR